MMRLSRACELAIRAIDDAYASLEDRRKDGGMSYRVIDPATENAADMIVPAGDESAQGAFCRRCLDVGLIFVLLDGAPARARCTCSASEPWREKVAAYADVFTSPPPLERPRYVDPELELLGSELELLGSELELLGSELEPAEKQISLIPEMSDEAIRQAMYGQKEY